MSRESCPSTRISEKPGVEALLYCMSIKGDNGALGRRRWSGKKKAGLRSERLTVLKRGISDSSCVTQPACTVLVFFR